ncbi:PLP-dependent aspartate aminotransferase family protein [Ligilactobacillus sp. WILCCON 0076]|uniref:PLP-dependent aspartate aminotransferase family protein n=1 Tax=Ligilactobacillus ubinensis TaxID=2876789 RepID=A0A9X2JKH1_9LACO|nr:PLP-dependent aspartate aminotransferase family protein [Ligilactobacillus ubinensis]MCP0885780.1 PLP-dependent aspartate aminotransferase family protein [Ligilactobacillus ubinensis]
MQMNTKLLHGYPVIDPATGASSIPKYQASTFNSPALGVNHDYMYTRFGNPTVHALEEGIASLENAKYAYAFSSGMAAISTTLMLLKQNEHIILPIKVYGGTGEFAHSFLSRYGVEVSFVDFSDINKIEQAIKDNTAFIYLETPSNPLLDVTDIQEVVALAKKYNILTIADNTFMTPVYQKPLDLGCDIVIESMTKFINGHSDVIAGAVATNNSQIAKTLYDFQKEFGGILGVEDAWLILRGMKTLGLRMSQSVKNAQAIAEFLQKSDKVNKVYFPGLATSNDYAIQNKQAKNGGCVLSFELKKCDKISLNKFIHALKIPIFAVSLGGVESILSHPATMSHACLSPEEREAQGVTDGLLRLSCGIEDTEDLLEDLTNALQSIDD